MGLKLSRYKKKNYLLSLIYRLTRLRLLSSKNRLRLFANLEWIFNRLAHEESFTFYDNKNHPVRVGTVNFLNPFLKTDYNVFDLGTNQGDLAVLIAPFVKSITGIDYQEKHILIAQKKHLTLNAKFIHMEAHEFLKNNIDKYDVLILSHILEHLDNPKSFLDNIKVFFEYIYVEVPDFESTNHNKYRVDCGSSLVYSDTDHIYEFDRKDIKDLLDCLNIKVISSEFRNGVQRHWCSTK
jgi:hypothetical protein